MSAATVPTGPFLEVVKDVMDRVAGPDVSMTEWLSNRCQINSSTLAKEFKKPEFDFYMADMILCGLHAVFCWHFDERLADIYQAVPLHLDRCHNPECNRDLPMVGGIQNQKCCDEICKRRAEAIRTKERYHAGRAA